MEASTAVASRSQEELKHQRIVLLTDSAAQLPILAGALHEFAGSEVREVVVWLQVERFYAPPGTHPPYRQLARIEARNITAERAAASETEARDLLQSWAARWQLQVEAVLDASAASVATRLREDEIDLVVTTGRAGRSHGLGAEAAALSGRSLLLVPQSGANLRQRSGSDSSRPFSGRLDTSHG